MRFCSAPLIVMEGSCCFSHYKLLPDAISIWVASRRFRMISWCTLAAHSNLHFFSFADYCLFSYKQEPNSVWLRLPFCFSSFFSLILCWLVCCIEHESLVNLYKINALSNLSEWCTMKHNTNLVWKRFTVDLGENLFHESSLASILYNPSLCTSTVFCRIHRLPFLWNTGASLQSWCATSRFGYPARLLVNMWYLIYSLRWGESCEWEYGICWACSPCSTLVTCFPAWNCWWICYSLLTVCFVSRIPIVNWS